VVIVRVICAVLMLAVSTIGPGMVFYGLRQRSKLRASAAWPRVDGRITKSAIEKDSDGDDADVSVEYAYSVKDVSYLGKRVRFGGWNAMPQNLQAELDRYRPGTAVAVFFDPDKPSEAVLMRDTDGSRWWIWLGILMIVMSLVGFAAFIFGDPDAPMID
jgi:hypothetical protein